MSLGLRLYSLRVLLCALILIHNVLGTFNGKGMNQNWGLGLNQITCGVPLSATKLPGFELSRANAGPLAHQGCLIRLIL